MLVHGRLLPLARSADAVSAGQPLRQRVADRPSSVFRTCADALAGQDLRGLRVVGDDAEDGHAQPLVVEQLLEVGRRCGCRGSRSRRPPRPACRPSRRCPSVEPESAAARAGGRCPRCRAGSDEHDAVGAREDRHGRRARDHPAAVGEDVGPVLARTRPAICRQAAPSPVTCSGERDPTSTSDRPRSLLDVLGQVGLRRRRGGRPRRARAGPRSGSSGSPLAARLRHIRSPPAGSRSASTTGAGQTAARPRRAGRDARASPWRRRRRRRSLRALEVDAGVQTGVEDRDRRLHRRSRRRSPRAPASSSTSRLALSTDPLLPPSSSVSGR